MLILYAIPSLLALPLASAIGIPVALADVRAPKNLFSTRAGNYPLITSAWYAGWHATQFPLSKVSWKKYNTLVYSFAETTPDVKELMLGPSDVTLLPQFVDEAHKHGVKAHIGIGGWGGSRFFSSAVATHENRTAFVKTVTDFVTKYKVDGVNIDWEYPGVQGLGCNIVNKNDTDNYLIFLQALRAHPIGANLTITAATGIKPFVNATGSPSTNISAFAEVFDYIQIMNYDIWGSDSPRVGPNAPLGDSCAPTNFSMGSAVSAVIDWTEAGMPREKIVLGVAGYGHSYRVKPNDAFIAGTAAAGMAAYPLFDAKNPPRGDAWDGDSGKDQCGVKEGFSGDFTYWGLIDGGFLTKEGKPAKGISYRYDWCSQTPYVYNATSQVMVSYDDPTSLAAKGQFIRYTGLRGFSLWEAGGDYHDVLVNAVTSNM